MTLTTISESALWYAIGQYLSHWPEGVTADQVLSEVELNTDDVVIWEPFQDYDGADIVGWIRDLAREFDLFAIAQQEQPQALHKPCPYRWYLGYILTREGEREHKQTAIMMLKPDSDVYHYANKLAADWWGSEAEVSGEGFLFFGGEIYVEAGSFYEISKEVAHTISDYPMHINWFSPDQGAEPTTKEGEHES